EVIGIVVARKVLRVMLLVAGGQLVFKGLRQHRADDCRWRRKQSRVHFGDAQQEAAKGLDVEVGIVLGVVTDVHVDGNVLRIRRDGDRRAEQTLKTSARAARTAV